MNERVRAAGRPPVGSYRNIPFYALMKMRGHSHWRGDQIAAICELMDIPQKDIGRLFFPQVNGGRKQ